MSVERVIAPRRRSIGPAEVDRLLPFHARRTVGPFIFADLMGPDDLPPGQGADVAPHPHSGLATVTYLFEGALVHRDSTGAVQRIEPGGVNWMTAGSGVAHSERSPEDARAVTSALAGLQTWVALPDESEEVAPSFQHAAADQVPALHDGGVTVRVLAGTAFGASSPVPGASPLFSADVHLEAGARLALPVEHEEHAVLVVDGEVAVDGTAIPARHLAVAASGDAVVRAVTPARVVTFGGAPVGRRYIWWNFVASSEERIEQARADWASGRIPPVPGETERIQAPAR